VFAIGVFFGLRIGEVLGLKVADVDFESRVLKVERSATRGVIKEAKGPEGKRQFRLPELAMEILRHWLPAYVFALLGVVEERVALAMIYLDIVLYSVSSPGPGKLSPFILVVEGSIPNEKNKSEGYCQGDLLDPAVVELGSTRRSVGRDRLSISD